MLDGRLELLTPEGVSLALTPAGPARRAMAWLVDFILWGIGFSITSELLGRIFSGSDAGRGLLLILLFVSYWGYPILFEVYSQGMTLGKRWMGIRVVRANGLPVRWQDSCLRNLFLVADFLPALYCSGLVCMLLDPHFRRMGDLVAGTLVVYREKPTKTLSANQSEPLPLPYALSPDEQRALLDFVERAQTMPEERCMELADLAQPLTDSVGRTSLQRLRQYAAGLTR